MAYEIRPMSFGEILDTGFRLLRNHFAPLMSIAALAYVPMGLSSLATTYLTAAGGEPDPAAVLPVLSVILGAIVALAITFPVMLTAQTALIGDVYLGRPTGAGAALRRAWRIFLPTVGTSLLASLIVGGAMLLLILPGFYFILAYWLFWQVMVLENVFGMAALRRSRDLMRGNFVRAIGIMLVGAVLPSVVSGGATWLLGGLPLLQTVVSTAIQAAGVTYAYVTAVVFYFDIRCRKESFDLEHLARLVESRSAAPALPTA